MFVGQFQDGCQSVKRVHHRFKHIHPMVNHFYNQLIMRKHTSKNTTDNVSSMLLSDFVPKYLVLDVNISTCNRINLWF